MSWIATLDTCRPCWSRSTRFVYRRACPQNSLELVDYRSSPKCIHQLVRSAVIQRSGRPKKELECISKRSYSAFHEQRTIGIVELLSYSSPCARRTADRKKQKRSS